MYKVNKKVGDFMSTFVIVNTERGTLHSEPSRPSWRSTSYKSAGAAKAGITRTTKFYQNAVDDVAKVVAEGKKEYHSRWYNFYREAFPATEQEPLGRDMLNIADRLEVVAFDDYVEPQITRTGRSPYNGNEITVTIGINSIGTHMDPLCESHYTN
tara:strand:- start:21 stop:485 length:465 start_codon:yes stop_codon:yes gene_type:complete